MVSRKWRKNFLENNQVFNFLYEGEKDRKRCIIKENLKTLLAIGASRMLRKI